MCAILIHGQHSLRTKVTRHTHDGHHIIDWHRLIGIDHNRRLIRFLRKKGCSRAFSSSIVTFVVPT